MHVRDHQIWLRYGQRHNCITSVFSFIADKPSALEHVCSVTFDYNRSQRETLNAEENFPECRISLTQVDEHELNLSSGSNSRQIYTNKHLPPTHHRTVLNKWWERWRRKKRVHMLWWLGSIYLLVFIYQQVERSIAVWHLWCRWTKKPFVVTPSVLRGPCARLFTSW